jgi:hypothetical protein
MSYRQAAELNGPEEEGGVVGEEGAALAQQPESHRGREEHEDVVDEHGRLPQVLRQRRGRNVPEGHHSEHELRQVSVGVGAREAVGLVGSGRRFVDPQVQPFH